MANSKNSILIMSLSSTLLQSQLQRWHNSSKLKLDQSVPIDLKKTRSLRGDLMDLIDLGSRL